MYSKCDPLLFSWQQRRSRVSLHWVATNSFAACFWVCCDTVGFYHCVLGKSYFVVVSVGLLPLSLFALLSLGWWDANLAGGSASCLLVVVFCVLVFMICQFACDHLCPCWSFLDNSLFSCKDRALERDRPYRRKKNWSSLSSWQLCQSWTATLTCHGLSCSFPCPWTWVVVELEILGKLTLHRRSVQLRDRNPGRLSSVPSVVGHPGTWQIGILVLCSAMFCSNFHCLATRYGLGQASPSREAPRLQAFGNKAALKQKGKDCHEQGKQGT